MVKKVSKGVRPRRLFVVIFGCLSRLQRATDAMQYQLTFFYTYIYLQSSYTLDAVGNLIPAIIDWVSLLSITLLRFYCGVPRIIDCHRLFER